MAFHQLIFRKPMGQFPYKYTGNCRPDISKWKSELQLGSGNSWDLNASLNTTKNFKNFICLFFIMPTKLFKITCGSNQLSVGQSFPSKALVCLLLCHSALLPGRHSIVPTSLQSHFQKTGPRFLSLLRQPFYLGLNRLYPVDELQGELGNWK